jgi:hypothetical protein
MNEYSDYIESHTALDDSRIEFQLARMFVAKHFTDFKTDFLNNVQSVSWTMIKKRLTSAEKMRIRRNDPKQLGKGIKQSEEQKDFFK